MNNTNIMVNQAILSSIPLDKKMKRYFLSKYRILANNNGLRYAAEIFSQMRSVSLEYRADPHRIERREEYIRRMPVRKNGWLRKLFDYLDSHPEYVLNFLKLYVGLNEPLVTVEQSANNQHQYLQDVAVNTDIPTYLSMWVRLIKMPIMTKSQWFHERHTKVRPGYEGITKFLSTHTYREYAIYVRKWKRILTKYTLTDTDVQHGLVSKEPLPEMYKDFDGLASTSLEEDFFDLSSMALYADSGGWTEEPAVSPESISFLLRCLNPNLIHLWDEITMGIWKPSKPASFLSGLHVGHMHHIPKKGTIERRPIAVPNRFLQMGMTPVYQALKGIVERLPQDATFNQARFDTKISNRVTNPNLYVGSVDLSQATDNLPFSWGEFIVDELILDRQPEEVKLSWQLFKETARAKWNNDGILTSWSVGQPLGTLPSFMTLAITHNLILEALSWWNGYGHSPYAVLGDDVVIFSRKLRNQYISDFSKRGIPLSLHKSFKGNLTEFAGKVYIRNHVPFHTSDQVAITWTNLFDYQVATGILIPWDNLPRKVKSRFRRQVLSVIPYAGNRMVSRVYHLIQMANVHRASGHFDYEAENQALINYFYEAARISEMDTEPVPEMRTGIVMLAGHPITYLDYGYAEKRGHKQRFQKVKLPDWYKSKFRPASTDTLVHCASIALMNLKGE